MEAKVIDYQRPTLKEGQPKAVKMLARTDRAFFAVQVVNTGGENNLHSHEHVDGFWFVLSGRARFYTTDDELLKECGPLEGVLVPRKFPYWFESCGDEPLEILQFEASDIPFGQPNEDRVDHAPQKAWMNFGGEGRSA
ncbi:MAG TPA: cupin domain-containing protein [Mycobacteriales bacterium]|nr:cupin domain-containing protein [Mycobacteriales bacterium]